MIKNIVYFYQSNTCFCFVNKDVSSNKIPRRFRIYIYDDDTDTVDV